ncbi:MAG: hypothetical protein RMI91_04095 [Gemmatales bacterium]|nr:hypothetical protein [Gemmatales bacterium]MDW7993815.1 hypothetical protein [Gemmatales bacterium]
MCRVCQLWTPLILDDPEIELPAEVRRHMELCGECRASLTVARRLAVALRVWPEPEPGGSPKAIAEKVLADRRERQQAQMRHMMAASLVLAVLAWFGLTALEEPQPDISSYRVAAQVTQTASSTEVIAASQPAISHSEHGFTDVQIARAQPSEAISDSTRYSVQELAYWFIPDSLRRSVEGMVEVVSPVLNNGTESDSALSLGDVLPVNWTSLEQLWHPLRDAGQNSLRLFRSLLTNVSQDSKS